MATQKAVIEVDIQGTEKVESMRTQMRKLREQLAQLPEGTAEFTQVQKQLGELKDKMDDLGKSVNTMSGGPLERLNNSFSMIGSSIMSLDFDNALTGMNGMSAALGDIKGKDIVGIFKNFGSALNNLGQALLSNPIFLIAGTIALIATNMDKVFKIFPSFEKALKGIGDEERAIAKAVEARAAASKKAYDQSALEVNQLKLAGKTEREILEYRMSRVKSSIEDAKIQLETSINQAKIQIDTAKRNKEILNGILMFINAPMTIILDMIDRIGQVVGKDFGLNRKFADLMTSFVVDPVQIETDLNNSITAQRDALKQMESDYAGFDIQLQEIDKKSSEKKVKVEKETTKKVTDEKIDRNKLLTQYNEEQADADIILAEEVAEKNAAQSKALTDKERANAVELHGEKKSLVADLNEVEKEAFNARMEMSDIETQHQIENEKKLRDAKFAARDAALKLAKEGEEAISNVGAAYFATKMSRIDRETKEGAAAYEVLAKKQFEFNKKMQLAGAIIDLARGINSSLAAAPVAIGPAPNPAGIASLAFVTATGLANIAKIAATKYQSSTSPSGTQPSPNLSGGGGGGQSPAALNLSAIQGNTNTAPIQSYVLAGQVSSAQQAEFKIKNTASILGGG